MATFTIEAPFGLLFADVTSKGLRRLDFMGGRREPPMKRPAKEQLEVTDQPLTSIPGLWVTGVSKIAHLLNDKLLVLLNLDISAHFRLPDGSIAVITWVKALQDSAKQVTRDFQERGYQSTPEEFISEKLGYTNQGCHKSLVKYLDEYYWLRFSDNLPIPPPWTPT